MLTNSWLFKTALLAVIFSLLGGCQAQVSTSPAAEASTPVVVLAEPSATATEPLPTATPFEVTDTPLPATGTPQVTATSWPKVVTLGPHDIQALLVLPKDLGPNWYLSEDFFESFGWNLTLTGAAAEIAPCRSVQAWYGLNKTEVDVRLADIVDLSAFDILAIMPASKKNAAPYGDLLDSPEMPRLIQEAYADGKVVYATCGGVRVLAAADILAGKTVAGEESFAEEYAAAGATYLPGKVMPVIQGNLVTTVNGLYFQVEDAEAVAVALEEALPADADAPGEVQTLSYEVAERSTAWTRTYGGLSAEGGSAVRQTSDGGYIIAGYTFSFGAGYADLYLVKVDAQGNLEWSNAYGGAGWEYGYAVAQTTDGGYVAAGYTTSSGMGGRDVYLVRTDAQGELLWQQTYGGEGLDVGKGLDVALDGGFIIAGYTESSGAGQNDILLVKTGADGDEQWMRTFGGDQSETGMAVRALESGGYALVGSTGSFGVVSRDAYLVRTDDEGVEIWSRTFGNAEGFLAFETGNALQATSDGGFILAGVHNAAEGGTGGELMNMYLVKTDENGAETWSAAAGRSTFYDYGYAIVEMPGGGFAVAGTTKSGSDNNDIYLAGFDALGTLLWDKSFGDFASEWGAGLAITADGGLLIVGQTNSFGAGSFDVWLVKVIVE